MSRANQSSASSSTDYYYQHRHPSTSSVRIGDLSTAHYSTPSPPQQSLHNSVSTSTLSLQGSEDFTLVAVDPSQSRMEPLPARSVPTLLPDAPQSNTTHRPDTLSPTTPTDRTRSTRHASRRALTEALRLAQEAVLLDSQNEDPIAAFRAYARSVTLLGEVMQRVLRGEHEPGRRPGRALTELAREDEARRLKNIHDTYAERMRILAEMYEIQDELPPGVMDIEVHSDQPVLRPAPSIQATYVEYQEKQRNAEARGRGYSTSSGDDSSAPQTPTLSEQHHSSTDSLRSAYNGDSIPANLSEREHSSISSPSPSPPRISHHGRPPTSGFSAAASVSRSRAALVSTRLGLPVGECSPNPDENHTSKIDEPERRMMLSYQDGGILREAPTTPRNGGAPADDFISPEATPRPVIASTYHSQPNSHHPNHASGGSVINRQGILVNSTTTEGTISQRRSKSSLGMHPSVYDLPSTPDSAAADPASLPPASKLTVPPSAKEHLARARAASQPGLRPPLFTNYSTPSGSEYGVRPIIQVQHSSGKAFHLSPLQTQLANTAFPSSHNRGAFPAFPTSPLPPPSPQDPVRKPYHLMGLLKRTMTSRTGGYITRKLHVPFEVWSQGGAKLTNLPEKVRTIEVLCSALEELEAASSEYCPIRALGGKLVGQRPTNSRNDMEKWLSKVDEWTLVCESVVGSVGRKLGVGEGFAIKKSKTMNSWSSKFARSLDKLTSSKNLDSPTTYVNGLIKLFEYAQLLDEHSKALTTANSCYSVQPMELRIILEARFKQSSEFFATVVLTFVIRDLSLLLDKYAKKGGQWLTE